MIRGRNGAIFTTTLDVEYINVKLQLSSKLKLPSPPLPPQSTSNPQFIPLPARHNQLQRDFDKTKNNILVQHTFTTLPNSPNPHHAGGSAAWRKHGESIEIKQFITSEDGAESGNLIYSYSSILWFEELCMLTMHAFNL